MNLSTSLPASIHTPYILRTWQGGVSSSVWFCSPLLRGWDLPGHPRIAFGYSPEGRRLGPVSSSRCASTEAVLSQMASTSYQINFALQTWCQVKATAFCCSEPLIQNVAPHMCSLLVERVGKCMHHPTSDNKFPIIPLLAPNPLSPASHSIKTLSDFSAHGHRSLIGWPASESNQADQCTQRPGPT